MHDENKSRQGSLKKSLQTERTDEQKHKPWLGFKWQMHWCSTNVLPHGTIVIQSRRDVTVVAKMHDENKSR